MGYWFSGFFLRMADQDQLPTVVSSIQEQWPWVVCRLVKEPFVGIGVRLTNYTSGAFEEQAEAQLAREDALPGWSTQHPLLTFVYLHADCFGGTCIYTGYVCRNGAILFQEQSTQPGPEPLRRLLHQLDVTLEGGSFLPLRRGFFGAEHYFRPGEVTQGLQDFVRQNTPLTPHDAH